MQYSPTLKKAAEEIKDVLKRYDIGGFVVLHTPGYTEYVLNITPSYSCASIENDMLRMKALQKDFPTKEAWKKKIGDTSDMLHGISKTGVNMLAQLMKASELLDEKVNAEHTDDGYTSHSTQNN